MKKPYSIQSLRQFSMLISCTIMLHTATAQTISDTFDISDIPTSLGAYSSTCNGPSTLLSVILPSGNSWNVTGIDIAYNMTALGGGFKSHQRSYVRCQNTSTAEATVYQGTGNTGGVQAYSRNNVSIANGPYAGGTQLKFEMRAWRTAIGAGCSTANNKVDIYSWIIIVHYSAVADEGSIGIGTSTPATSAIVEMQSTTQAFLPPRMTTMQRDAIPSPIPGMMIFNTSTMSLEIYTSSWGSIGSTNPGFASLQGGTTDEFVTEIIPETDGGFVVVGSSSSNNTGTLSGLNNNGNFDGWIARYDSKGQVLWQKLYGGSASDSFQGIYKTNDGNYIVVGESSSSNTGTLTGIANNGFADLWVLKLNSQGNIVWQYLFGGSNSDFGNKILQDHDNNYVIVGYSYSSNTGTLTGQINNGENDIWILKLDPNGTTIWQRLLGGTVGDYSNSLARTTDNGYIICGYTFSSNTGTLVGFNNAGLADVWILKLNSAGDIIWQKLYGGNGNDQSAIAILTSDGGFLVTASTSTSNNGTLSGITNNGNFDGWVIRLNDSGDIIWQKLFGGSLLDLFRWVVQTADGNFVISGTSSSSNTGSMAGLINHGMSDVWILKIGANGQLIWQQLYGGLNTESSDSIIKSPDGGYTFLCTTDSSNSGNLSGLLNNGIKDGWIFKLDKSGHFY